MEPLHSEHLSHNQQELSDSGFELTLENDEDENHINGLRIMGLELAHFHGQICARLAQPLLLVSQTDDLKSPRGRETKYCAPMRTCSFSHEQCLHPFCQLPDPYLILLDVEKDLSDRAKFFKYSRRSGPHGAGLSILWRHPWNGSNLFACSTLLNIVIGFPWFCMDPCCCLLHAKLV
jgi:hypothetical protein